MIRKCLLKILSVVLVLSILSPAAVIAAGERAIVVFFDDVLAKEGTLVNWAGCSWNTSVETIKNGNSSLHVQFSPSNAWEGLTYTFNETVTGVVDVENTAVCFWAKTPRGDKASITLQVITRDASGRDVAANIPLSSYIVDTQAGKWTYVQIPLENMPNGEYWNGSYNETVSCDWTNIIGLGFKTDGTALTEIYNLYLDDWKIIENIDVSKNTYVNAEKEKEQKPVVKGEYEKDDTYVTLFDDYLNNYNIYSGISRIETTVTERKVGRASAKITFDTANYHGANIYFENLLKFDKDSRGDFALHFWIKVPKEISLTLGFTESTEMGNVKTEVDIFDYIYSDQINTWTEVNIPLSKFGTFGIAWNPESQSNEAFSISWEKINSLSITVNTNGLDEPYVFYMDDISIVDNTVVEYTANVIGVEENSFDKISRTQNFTKIDLKPYMNMEYRDEVYHDNMGGWIDQGDDDMRNFNLRGEQTFLNVPFDIVQPEDNNGKSVLVLRGQNRMNFPNEVEIPINNSAAGIYFMHCAAWVEPKVGEYVINYADGSMIRVVLNQNIEINDWGENFISDVARTVYQTANDNGKMGGFGVFAWANPKPEVKIKSITAKTTGRGSYLMLEAITLTDKGPYMPIPNSIPETNPDTSNWYEYEQPDYKKLKGSVLDMSGLLDAPAGKHGFVRAVGEDFVFDDGTRAKFIGTNIVAQANFQSKEKIDDMLDRVAAAGYNLIRLHHLDASWSNPNIFGNTGKTTELDSIQLDKFDYLCAKAKEKGIYLYIDGLVHRKFTQEDLPNSKQSASASEGAKIAGDIDDALILLEKEYLKQLFTHKNKYTGLSLAEDPALVMVDIHNEDSLLWRDGALGWLSPYHKNMLDTMFNDWLKERYKDSNELKNAWQQEGKNGLAEGEFLEQGNISLAYNYYDDEANNYSDERKKDICRFLFDTQVEYYNDMCDYMRNELEMQCMICGSNVPETRDTLDILANATISADYVDRHRYYTHPIGSTNYYVAGLLLGDTMNPMVSFGDDRNMVYYFGKRRVYGMPYVLSEWNSCEPNQYSGGDMMYMNAYSAMNNWTPINFAFLQGFASLSNKLNFVFNTSESPTKIAMQSASAALMLRNDVSEAEYGYYVPVTKNMALDTNYEQYIPVGAPMIAKTGIMWTELDKTNPDMGANYAEIKNIAENADGVYVSITGELKTDTKQKLFEVNTPRSQGFSGILEGKKLVYSDMDFESNNHYAAVLLTSLNDEAISNSEHLLLCATARNRNTNQVFSNDGTIMKNGGEPPILMEQVCGKMYLKTGYDYDVYILNTSGERVKQLATTRMPDGSLEIELSIEDKTMYYELVKKDVERVACNIGGPEWSKITTLEHKNAFTDIDGHWAERIINNAQANNLFLQNEQDGTFSPDGFISRGAFTAWTIRAAGITIEGDGFVDVAEDSMYAKEITAAKKCGIVTGYDDGRFEPDAPITREEMSVIVARVLLYTAKIDTGLADLSYLASYGDKNEISQNAAPYISKLTEHGIVCGRDGVFYPKALLTRAEAVVLADKVEKLVNH